MNNFFRSLFPLGTPARGLVLKCSNSQLPQIKLELIWFTINHKAQSVLPRHTEEQELLFASPYYVEHDSTRLKCYMQAWSSVVKDVITFSADHQCPLALTDLVSFRTHPLELKIETVEQFTKALRVKSRLGKLL